MKDIITLIELFIAVFIVPTVGMLIGSYVVMGLEKEIKEIDVDGDETFI